MRIQPLISLLLAFTTVINSHLVRMPVKKTNTMTTGSPTSFRNLDSQVGSMKITNFLNTQYTGTIKVGSTQKEFSVILDTGSSTLWIPDMSASSQFPNKFNCETSTTCRSSPTSQYSISYGQGDIAGYKVTDRVKFGEFDLPQFNMLLVFDIQDLPGDNFDGILGLGLGRHYQEFPTLLETLKRTGQIEEEAFSMYLGDSPNSNGDVTGEIIFGGYDPQYAGTEFKFVSIYDSAWTSFWAAKMKAIAYGTERNISNLANFPAVFDSGTSLLVMPEYYVNYVIEQGVAKGVKFSYDSENELYMCSCGARNTMEDLVFYFEGATLYVPASSYIVLGYGGCFLGMQVKTEAVTLDSPVILGDILLKNYYLLYSAKNSTIGFAEAAPIRFFPVYFIYLFIIGALLLVGTGIYYCNKARKSTTTATRPQGTFSSFKSKGVVIGSNYGNELSSQFRYSQHRSTDDENKEEAAEDKEVPNYPPAA